MHQWHVRHKTGRHERWELAAERKRQRELNPAYDPRYSEEDLRRASEVQSAECGAGEKLMV